MQLPPDSPMAMDGNRYPITEIGFQNLTKRLIEVLEKEQQYNDGVIEIFRQCESGWSQVHAFPVDAPQASP